MLLKLWKHELCATWRELKFLDERNHINPLVKSVEILIRYHLLGLVILVQFHDGFDEHPLKYFKPILWFVFSFVEPESFDDEPQLVNLIALIIISLLQHLSIPIIILTLHAYHLKLEVVLTELNEARVIFDLLVETPGLVHEESALKW